MTDFARFVAGVLTGGVIVALLTSERRACDLDAPIRAEGACEL